MNVFFISLKSGETRKRIPFGGPIERKGVLNKMNAALFTYNKKVTIGSEDKIQPNYINPLAVTSFFWQYNEKTGEKVLNVFLSNDYCIPFQERTGERFVEHMEAFLCYLINSPLARFGTTAANEQSNYRPNKKRHFRTPVTEAVEEVMMPESFIAEPAG